VNPDKHSKETNIVIVSVIASIIGVIIIGGIAGFFLYRRYQAMNIVQKGSMAVEQSSRAHMTPASPEVICGDDEMFQDQYHPEPVVDIFGRGNDMIKKANMADDVIEEENEESEANSSPTRTASGNSNNNLQVDTSRAMNTNARESVL
jgi:hypothetical protein